MSKFINQRVHERADPKLMDRARLARQRTEGEAPLYRRVVEAHAMQLARIEAGKSW